METRVYTHNIVEDLLAKDFVVQVWVNAERREDLDVHAPTREEAEAVAARLGLPDTDGDDWETLLF